MKRHLLPRSLGLALLSGSTWAANPAYVELPGKDLVQGRILWLESCEGCHGYGIAGAPIPMHPEEWQARLQKPQSTLYQHAIDGFFGPDDTMMPPRGGNPQLTDHQVRLAVDYMTGLAQYHLQTNGDK